MTALALLFAGYSFFSALALAGSHFRGEVYRGRRLQQGAGLLLLAALAGLQLAHFAWLYAGLPWIADAAYRIALFAVAPAFFLFSTPLLCPGDPPPSPPALLAHAAPLAAAPLLPAGLALPAAFVVGAGYLLWLARNLYALRHQRSGFAREMALLGAAFVIAVGVSLLGLMQATLPAPLFYSLYAIAIGLAFLLVQTALGLRPQLEAEVGEAAQAAAAYAHSTLRNIDCDALLDRLAALMRDERCYVDPELDLARLAARLGLSPHQLSEFINTRLGRGFSRYLREQRVAAARAMLLAEPSASVLAVGLNVGFTSQSNFYEAFREIEGTTPGQFRKLARRQTPG